MSSKNGDFRKTKAVRPSVSRYTKKERERAAVVVVFFFFFFFF